MIFRRKTLREQEMEHDHEPVHQKQMFSKRKQYVYLKKEVNQLKRELGTFLFI